jgi:hypothetical protein
MKPTTLATLLTLAITGCSSTPVYAQETKEMAARLIRQASVKGVEVLLAECTTPQTYGRYLPRNGRLIICQKALREGLLVQTLTHELVHAAQDCTKGRLGDGHSQSLFSWLYRNNQVNAANTLKEAVLAKLSRVNYRLNLGHISDPETKVSEYEAYALEDHPKQVLSIFNIVCR